MRISSISIDDTFGTTHAEFAPGSITRISGMNGSGKTSLVNAIGHVFEGGSDPSIIRNGAKKSVIRLTLDTGVVITKTTTPSGARLEITDAAGLVVPSPKKFIEQLGDSMAVNPSAILALDTKTSAGRKALMSALLAVMPVSVAADDIRAEATDANKTDSMAALLARVLPSAPMDLAELDKYRKQIEETRRPIGVEAKSAGATVDQLSRSLLSPEEVACDWPARQREAEAALKGMDTEEREKLAEITHAVAVERQAAQDEFEVAAEALRVEFNRRSSELKRVLDEKFSKAARVEQAAREEVLRSLAPERERIAGDLATIREKSAAVERDRGARKTIEQMRVQAREKAGEYDRYTALLAAIDAAKKRKLDSLPIPGLEFDGDRVLVGGVPWEHVNTAKRVEVALQICSLRAGELPFLILDDAEHLDAETWEVLSAGLADAGFQVLAALVSEGPLTIEMEA